MNDQRQGKIPTIHDVSRIADVGIGTVSRVINDSPGVKPATRQRVLAAIDALHYSPNLIARSMISSYRDIAGRRCGDFSGRERVSVVQYRDH